MGILGKIGHDEPPTVTDYPGHHDISTIDAEKAEAGVLEDGVVHEHHVNTEAERAVVRKMDMRVVPLVSLLCMECHRFLQLLGG